MVYLNLTATARCEEKACEKTVQDVLLVLMLAGGFSVARESLEGWQVIQIPLPGQPLRVRCPDHHLKVDTAGQRVEVIRG